MKSNAEGEGGVGKQPINRGRFLLGVLRVSAENQMYRCLSYVRQPRLIEWRNDRQAVYQRVSDFWITDRWVTGVANFYLISRIDTLHMGIFDATVDRNTRFGGHRSIGH